MNKSAIIDVVPIRYGCSNSINTARYDEHGCTLIVSSPGRRSLLSHHFVHRLIIAKRRGCSCHRPFMEAGSARGKGLAAGSRTEAVARTRADEIAIQKQKMRKKQMELDKLREELGAMEARAREETEERTRCPTGEAEILAA